MEIEKLKAGDADRCDACGREIPRDVIGYFDTGAEMFFCSLECLNTETGGDIPEEIPNQWESELYQSQFDD